MFEKVEGDDVFISSTSYADQVTEIVDGFWCVSIKLVKFCL